MKTIFKKFKLRDLIFFIIGGLVIGSIGITATTNRLEAKYVMYTKDGKTMTVQDAIKDLYVLAKNNGGGNSQTLPLSTVAVSGTQITIPYTGTYDKVTCVYGTDENYGNEGKINGNTCTFSGSSNTTYYYKLIATKIANNTGTVYENSGNKTTLSGPTAIKTGLPTGVKAIVYLDPTNLSASCNADNSNIGSGTSGCMKWYAFSEDNTTEANASYTMILDHNTKQVAWNSTGSTTDGMKEVQTELDNLEDITGWKVTPRLISKQEIVDITGVDSLDGFDTNCSSGCSTGSNKYYWLIDYTGYCTNVGCKVADSNSENYGYWTDTSINSELVWAVHANGKWTFDETVVCNADSTHFGLRPVITVQKSNF